MKSQTDKAISTTLREKSSLLKKKHKVSLTVKSLYNYSLACHVLELNNMQSPIYVLCFKVPSAPVGLSQLLKDLYGEGILSPVSRSVNCYICVNMV